MSKRIRQQKNDELASNGGSQLKDFCPPEDIWQCVEIFFTVLSEQCVSWHLVGRSQEHC